MGEGERTAMKAKSLARTTGSQYTMSKIDIQRNKVIHLLCRNAKYNTREQNL